MPYSRDDERTASHNELASSSNATGEHQPQTDAELLASVAVSGTVVANDADDEPPALLDEPPALLPANFAETLSRRHSRASSSNSSPPPPTSTWMSPERYVLVGGPARGPGVSAQADASDSVQSEPTSPGAVQVDMNGATLNIEPNADDQTYQAALAAMGVRALRLESLELVSSALIRRLQVLRGQLTCYVCLEPLLNADRPPSPTTTTADAAPDTDEPVRAIPCRHLFHEGCISPWLADNTTCPTCRYDAAPPLQLDVPPSLSGAPIFNEIDWDIIGDFDELDDRNSDDFAASSPDSERPTTPPPTASPTRRDGVYVAGNDQSSPPRTPMRSTSGADRDEDELGGSPDDKSDASPSAQARISAPPPPPQSPLSRGRAERTDDSDGETTDEEDAPSSPPRTPLRPTFPRDSVRTPSLSPEMPFRPRTPPRAPVAFPLQRLDTVDRALLNFLAQPTAWEDSPSAVLPEALSLSISLDDLRANASASIELSAPPSAISFQPLGGGDATLSDELVAAGLRLDSILSDSPRADSPELNADDNNVTVTVGSQLARELFGLPSPQLELQPPHVTWVDAIKPAVSFADWVAELEAKALETPSEGEPEHAAV